MAILKIRETDFWIGLTKNKYLQKILKIRLFRFFFDLLLPSEDTLGIPIRLGTKGFFKKINELNINYVVLRDFEDLPAKSNASDIDFLVADYDYLRFMKLVSRRPSLSTFRIDVSVAFTNKKNIIGIPEYTFQLANNSLKFKKKNFINQPSDYFYYWTYLFHTVIHKGNDSLIASNILKRSTDFHSKNRNKYLYRLSQLSKKDIKLPKVNSNCTLEDLFMILEKSPYMPNLDTLFKYSYNNLWLETFLADWIKFEDFELPPGLVVFFIRSSNSNQSEEIENQIKHFSKNKTHRFKLSDEQIETCSKSVRGSNWPKKDGGLPSDIVITNLKLKDKNSYLKEVDFIKSDLRAKKVFMQTKDCKFSNVVHSSDNSILAAHYLNILGFKDNEIKNFID